MHSRKLVACLVVAAAFAPASPAGADSLVFIKTKKNYIYVSKADGSRAHRLTKTGGYYWPSQADNGTIVAAGGRARFNPEGTDSSGGTELYRFNRRGRRLGRPITTAGSHSTPQCPTYAPQSVRVSPDGRRIAYSIFMCDHLTTFWTPSRSRGLNFPGQTVGQQNTAHPVWIDNGRLLLGRIGTPVTEEQREFGFYGIGGGDNTALSWFDGTPGFEPEFEATISRKGDKIAVFSFDFDLFGDTTSATLRLFSASGPPPAQPVLRCQLRLRARKFPEPYRLVLSRASRRAGATWRTAPGTASTSSRSPTWRTARRSAGDG